MREQNLPAWAVGIGAEVRKRTDEPPLNEQYLLDVSECLREISDQELADRRLRCGRGDPS